MKTKKTILLCLILIPLSTNAVTVTVKKIKGRQAIVESSIPLEEGQSYELQNDEVAIDALTTKNQIRKNSLQLGAQLQSLTGTNVQQNEMGFSGRYGWNFENFEGGPTLTYESIDLGAGTDSTILVGGFIDYNLTKNKSPNIMIWGPTASVDFGSKQFKAGGSASLLNIDGGGFLTWFMAQSSTALRIDGKYHIQKISTTTTETTLSGFKSNIYLILYF